MDYTYINSPVGELLVAGDCDGLTLISFPAGNKCRQHKEDWTNKPNSFSDIQEQLDAYFKGRLTRFDIDLKPQGTAFQLQVWKALQDVPYGETISYGELATTINKPTASRAVGAANGSNPLPIVIPCHRVIGSTGKLTGFGGGIETKALLLDLERKYSPNNVQTELLL